MSSPETFEEAFEKVCRQEGRLSDRLGALSHIIQYFDARFTKSYDELVQHIASRIPSPQTPCEGDRLPPFLLPDQTGRLANSIEFLNSGPFVVSFNRGHWCEYCQLELRAYVSAHHEFMTRGASVVSIMPERMAFTKQLAQDLNIPFPILSDMDNGYALELDLVMWLGDDVSQLLRGIGTDLERYQGNGMWFLPVPATFVVNPHGMIVRRFVDPDFRKRMDIEEVLAAIDEIGKQPQKLN